MLDLVCLGNLASSIKSLSFLTILWWLPATPHNGCYKVPASVLNFSHFVKPLETLTFPLILFKQIGPDLQKARCIRTMQKCIHCCVPYVMCATNLIEYTNGGFAHTNGQMQDANGLLQTYCIVQFVHSHNYCTCEWGVQTSWCMCPFGNQAHHKNLLQRMKRCNET